MKQESPNHNIGKDPSWDSFDHSAINRFSHPKKGGRLQAKIQKYAYWIINKITSAVTGRKIERLIHSKIIGNIKFLK